MSVFTGHPTYTKGARQLDTPLLERLDGIDIRRARVRIPARESSIFRGLDVAGFTLAAGFHVLFRAPSNAIVLSLAYPPVLLGAIVGTAARIRRLPHVYLVMDLHPESAAALGLLRFKRVATIARKIDSLTMRGSAHVVTLSEDMANTIGLRFSSQDQPTMSIIPDFAVEVEELDEQSSTAPGVVTSQNDRVRFLYAGHFGRAQGLTNFVKGATGLPHDAGVEVCLMGDGSEGDRLRSIAGDHPCIRFIDRQPPDVAQHAIREADVCILTLRPGIASVANPAKVSNYTMAGRPLLALIDDGSALAEEIESGGIGWVCDPSDVERLPSLLMSIASDRAGIQDRATKSVEHFARSRSTEVLTHNWKAVLKAVLQQQL